MRDLLSGSRFLICENYGIGEKCTKGRPTKVPAPAPCTNFLKNYKRLCHFAFTFRLIMSFIMKGIFQGISSRRLKPVARICNMHKYDTHSFGNNRENSNFAVKGVPFLAIFVGTYEGTFFQNTEVTPMTRKARRGKNTKQPVSVHRLMKHPYASRVNTT